MNGMIVSILAYCTDLANEHGNSYEISICKKKELISFNHLKPWFILL